MTDQNQPLIAALMAFADKRGHWPDCKQSRRIGIYSRPDGPDEVVQPCSKKCQQARKAIEAAGGTVDQIIGPRPHPASDARDWDAIYAARPGCRLLPHQPYHHEGCRHVV